MENQDPIISLLTEGKILDEDTLKTALAEHRQTGKSLVSILKKGKLVSEEQLTKLVAAAHNIEYIELTADMIDPMAVRLISRDTARQYHLIPVRIENDTLYVAMHSPLNLSIIRRTSAI